VPNAISNTSPLVYLHRIEALHWLPQLFDSVWAPAAVVDELRAGLQRGYDVPEPDKYEWLEIVTPRQTPSEWFALDLGAGEIAAMSLALENRERVVILDDALARHVAHAAGLSVWGTLRVILTAKDNGLTETVTLHVDRLRESGMWISDEVRNRIIQLAGERY
jgi:predicted nucleic acid-binding protein